MALARQLSHSICISSDYCVRFSLLLLFCLGLCYAFSLLSFSVSLLFHHHLLLLFVGNSKKINFIPHKHHIHINYQMYSLQYAFASQCLRIFERGINSNWFYLYFVIFFDRIVEMQTDWINPLCSAHETDSDLNNTPWHIDSLLTLASQWSRW